MKFLRTIRLDDADLEIYEHAAGPGEWAVPGSFAFLDDTVDTLEGKRLQAFRSGFLGTQSFGWSTLVQIDEIGDDEYQQVIDRLAQRLVARHGAPHIAAALPLAAEEVDYAQTICEHPQHTLLALERSFGDDGIVENLRVVRPHGADHGKLRLWG